MTHAATQCACAFSCIPVPSASSLSSLLRLLCRPFHACRDSYSGSYQEWSPMRCILCRTVDYEEDRSGPDISLHHHVSRIVWDGLCRARGSFLARRNFPLPVPRVLPLVFLLGTHQGAVSLFRTPKALFCDIC